MNYEYNVQVMNTDSKKILRLELELLNKIQNGENLTQRIISRELNVALGMANTLIKRLVKKGFLKLKLAPMKRYLYYLTPKGMLEKTKLTREYLESSLQFYSNSRKEYESLFKKINEKNYQYIVLAGSSELAEIAILAAVNSGINVNYVYSPSYKKKSFSGIRIINNINKKKFNHLNTCFFLTELEKPKETFEYLKSYKIYKPKFLMMDSK
tara:strand:- start:276 stop:908 length:633 start_codon:yes stop_codon:yes gene_type:complete